MELIYFGKPGDLGPFAWSQALTRRWVSRLKRGRKSVEAWRKWVKPIHEGWKEAEGCVGCRLTSDSLTCRFEREETVAVIEVDDLAAFLKEHKDFSVRYHQEFGALEVYECLEFDCMEDC